MSRFKRRMKRRQQQHPKPELKLVEKDDRATVAVCIPSDDHVHAAFLMSLMHMTMQTMVTEDSGIKAITVQHVGASILPHSRYTLVKQGLEKGASHLLFLDSDMTFPPDTAIRLLRHDVDMVGVNAMSRRPPYNVTAWEAPGQRTMTTKESTGIEKAWRTGFAVVMVKAEVFEKMAPPYFAIQYIPETDQFRGEDYIFFDRAKEAGFQLWIDHDLSKEVNHIGSFAFNPLLAQNIEIRNGQVEESAGEKRTA